MTVLEQHGTGVWRAVDGSARIIDRSGEKRLPIGDDGFVSAMQGSVLVDKTMIIADVLDSGYKCSLFCRPRRFGKTLNVTMMKAFFEIPPENDPTAHDMAPLFEGTAVWDARDGYYRRFQGAFPVVYVSLRTAKAATWSDEYGALRNLIIDEYARHAYLAYSKELDGDARALFARLRSGSASSAEYADSLRTLCRLLSRHHRTGVIVLIDEYDAPVMAGYSAPDGGYYRQVVDFLKRWLTGALKDGGEFLRFACLTGVQRISKESIFSDLNNLVVSTSLSTISDERFGFTDSETAALAAYMGCADCMDEAREWYDGYRFGNVNVYNPWSVLNYLDRNCTPGVYWANTSGNEVIGDLVRNADSDTLAQVYDLLKPGGYVAAPLDLGVVFPDVGVRSGALWSMLYLAGYLTTEDTAWPDRTQLARRLRIPNLEIADLYRGEVVERFAVAAGGSDRLGMFHDALVCGDAVRLQHELSRMLRDSLSHFDLSNENAYHMLLTGLCFGTPGYADPRSNRESGYGRYDLQLVPAPDSPVGFSFIARDSLPLITIELKYLSKADAPADTGALDSGLRDLAESGIRQIRERGYDVGDLPETVTGRLRYGIAFSGKHVAVSCQQA